MDFETGATIATLTERELRRIQSAPLRRVQPPVEPNNGSVVNALVKAAMPAVIRDSRAIQAAKAARAKR
jgi:hypothetical protein